MNAAATLLGLTLLTSPAPPAPERPLLFGVTVGMGQTDDDEGSIGSGLAIGGDVGWSLNRRFALRAAVERLAHSRTMAGGNLTTDGATVFATGEARYRFRAGPGPYVSGGAGFAVHNGTFDDRFSAPPASRKLHSVSPAFTGAAGVEVSATSRVSVSPEVKVYFCQPDRDSDPWAALRVGVTIGFRR